MSEEKIRKNPNGSGVKCSISVNGVRILTGFEFHRDGKGMTVAHRARDSSFIKIKPGDKLVIEMEEWE